MVVDLISIPVVDAEQFVKPDVGLFQLEEAIEAILCSTESK